MKNFISLVVVLFLAYSCQKHENQLSKVNHLNGKVQKGPFLTGSDITIYELDNNLIQTGKVYNSTIINDQGDFNLPGVNFTSNYVLIKAEGMYFHELVNALAPSAILYSIIDLSNGSTSNVNLLTDIEKDRIEYLVSNGSTPQNAMIQANNELLKVFNLDNYTISNANQLEISTKTVGNEILLAITSIITGKFAGNQLSEFLTKIRVDFVDNGKIDDIENQHILMTNALLSAPTMAVANLITRYNSLGLKMDSLTISNYVMQFINNSSFQGYFETIFPRITLNGKNLINLPDGVNLDTSVTYTIAMNNDPALKNVWICLKDVPGNVIMSNGKWDDTKNSQFVIMEPNIFDNKIILKGHGEMTLRFYVTATDYESIYIIRKYRW